MQSICRILSSIIAKRPRQKISMWWLFLQTRLMLIVIMSIVRGQLLLAIYLVLLFHVVGVEKTVECVDLLHYIQYAVGNVLN